MIMNRGMRENHANGFKMKWVVVSLIDRKSARLTVLLSAMSTSTRCCIALPSQRATGVATVWLVSRANCINTDTIEFFKNIHYTRQYLKPQPSGYYTYLQFNPYPANVENRASS
jgi:hypothetical protein